ncbi:hypothetical protein B0H13DRAFT_1587566, partial [Mycena leptocephala]
LGLRIQLGHIPGDICTTSHPAPVEFVVYDVLAIHTVAVDYCRCEPDVELRQQLMCACWWPSTTSSPHTCAIYDCLRFFQLLNCLGKVAAHNYLLSLEYLTNNNGLTTPPVCNSCIHLHIAAGRALSPGSICQKDGRMYWQAFSELLYIAMVYNARYIHWAPLGTDVNFKLTTEMVSSFTKDPIIGDGLGYFCNYIEYTEHISKHVDEKDISSCSGFQAMFQSHQKRDKGLRTTGVGGVTCSRHNMWQPNGMGDLQRGERYCNMDFLIFSVLWHYILLTIILSYDIACQWSKNISTRMAKLPEKYHIKIPFTNIWFMVPNFHLPTHKALCLAIYSFHFMWGAGLTNGEGVEQNWKFSNGATASTKKMGPGSRHAVLEDIWGFHNWRREIAMRKPFKFEYSSWS